MPDPTDGPTASGTTAESGRNGPPTPGRRHWSDGYPDLSEHDVLEAISNADIRTLALALDEGAFRGHHGREGFTCPHCRYFNAEIVSPSIWWCPQCDQAGTRYELAHLVACDGHAAIRAARLTRVLR